MKIAHTGIEKINLKNTPAKSAKVASNPEAGKNGKINDGFIRNEDNEEASGVFSKIGSWLKENITGSATEKGLFRHCKDYSKQHKRYAAIGASAGGAVGVAAGLYVGREELKTDQPQLVWNNHDIKDPKLTGFRHSVSEVGHTERDYVGTDRDGNPQYVDRYEVDGYWHHYSPTIKYRQVGNYQTPGYEHSSPLTPFTGALLGLVSGTIVGGVLGLATSLIQKTIEVNKVNKGKE